MTLSPSQIKKQIEAEQAAIIKENGKFVQAFAKFKKSKYNLDSFKGLQMDSMIPKARLLLKVMKPRKVENLRKLLVNYGDCLNNNYQKNKITIFEKCKYASELEIFLDEVSKVSDYAV